jgi:alkylation response protein AidB-like acyl-CoA dehydrogenase
MAQGAYDAALKYSKLRKQFGRPISEFQAIQHKLVDMATEIDAARLLTYRAAWMKDQGKRVTRESAMAKLFASESPCASPTKPCRFTAATASSRTIRSRSSIAT